MVAGQVGVYYADAEMVTELGFFYGYSPIVWAAIFLQVRRAWHHHQPTTMHTCTV